MSHMLTHTPAMERFSLKDIDVHLHAIQNRIDQNATLSPQQKSALHFEAEQLSLSEFGRFLIVNNGALSGWWTYYCILGFQHDVITNPVETFLLEASPVILATRERFQHFQSVLKNVIAQCQSSQPIKIASIPGGMAADLLTLLPVNPAQQSLLRFVNIDLDAAVFPLSHTLAKQVNCTVPLECRQADAWSLNTHNEFQVICSNGLNIYVPERDKVVALFASFFQALKPGGTLITSALTPPVSQDNCEWHMEKIDLTALSRQTEIFAQILQAKWANFCTTQDMLARLTEAGFVDIRVIPDTRNIFPTFVSSKPV